MKRIVKLATLSMILGCSSPEISDSNHRYAPEQNQRIYQKDAKYNENIEELIDALFFYAKQRRAQTVEEDEKEN